MHYSKKGQIDIPIVAFVVIAISLIMIAPVMLKLFVAIKAPVSNQLRNITGGAQGADQFDRIMGMGIGMWDKIIVAFFFIAMLFMFLSAFMIDTHPFWIIIYILVAFLLMLFAPNIVDSMDKIYSSPTFAVELEHLSFMNFIRIHFGEVFVGMIVITGIIMYGKVKLFSSNGGGRA